MLYHEINAASKIFFWMLSNSGYGPIALSFLNSSCSSSSVVCFFGLNVKLTLLGPLIEGGNFWDGFETERGGDDWLDRADAAVLPAYVEHKPRRLLLAAACGIPVIASPACGIAPSEFITVVEPDDIALLREKIASALGIN